jgi:hypothetical protein
MFIFCALVGAINDSIIKVFSPTDAKLDNLTNSFNFALKLTLKSSYMFPCENTIIRDHTIRALLKLQLLK